MRRILKLPFFNPQLKWPNKETLHGKGMSLKKIFFNGNSGSNVCINVNCARVVCGISFFFISLQFG